MRTFWLFAVFGLIAFAWIVRAVPETKGRSLEDIERVWSRHAAARMMRSSGSRPEPGR